MTSEYVYNRDFFLAQSISNMPPEVNSISPPINKILKDFKDEIEATVNGENEKPVENPSRKREAIGRADQMSVWLSLPSPNMLISPAIWLT